MEGDRNNNERRPRSWFHLLDSLICYCKNNEEEEDRAEGFVYYPRSQSLLRTAPVYVVPVRTTEKAATESKNERPRMVAGPVLPFFLTFMTPQRGQQEVSVTCVSRVAAAGPAINKTMPQRGQEEESVASVSQVAGPAINKTRKRRLAKRRPRQIAVSPEVPVIHEE